MDHIRTNSIFHLKTPPAGVFTSKVSLWISMVRLAPLRFKSMAPTTPQRYGHPWKPLHLSLPPHIIFHLDSQYVLDLLLGLSLPSSNLELAILLLDYYHYLSSQTCVELRKAKSHTGMPGNDRADLNATKGLSPPTPLPEDLPPFHPLNFLLYLT